MAISFGKYENYSFKDYSLYFLTDSTIFIAVNIILVIVFCGKESTDFIDNLCTIFIAVNIILVIVFCGKESTDFIDNLCQTKFND